MRIVTFDALNSGVVCFWVDTGNTVPLACCIGKICVAAETKQAAAIRGQFLRVVRMLQRRTVTVFTGNYAVQFFSAYFNNLSVAFAAVLMHPLAS